MDILLSEELQSPAIDRLEKKYRVVRDAALWREPARLQTALAEARAIMIRNQTRLTAEVLAGAPKLLAIGRIGVGLDNIDVKAASQLGIVVVSPVAANAVSVAELALGLILALARRIPLGDQTTKAGKWDRKNCTGIELEGKTLAVCGFGRIGRLVATRARAFGMKIAAYDPFVDFNSPAVKELGAATFTNLESALAEADFVSMHLPLTPETKNIFNAKTFAAMKAGSYLINTSRGGVVDEGALLEALKSGRLGGAALDVREVEPPTTRGELETLANVILTPHVGAFTVEAQTRTFEAVGEDLDRLLSGGAAINFVNQARPQRGGV
jgi:D-3-phosphoglycerate dehydrogenase